MTEIEIKSLKTQIQLLNDIKDCDNMILYLIQDNASACLKIIGGKRDDLSFTVDEFNSIKNFLINISNNEGLSNLNSWISQKYLIPKEQSLKTLSILK